MTGHEWWPKNPSQCRCMYLGTEHRNAVRERDWQCFGSVTALGFFDGGDGSKVVSSDRLMPLGANGMEVRLVQERSRQSFGDHPLARKTRQGRTTTIGEAMGCM